VHQSRKQNFYDKLCEVLLIFGSHIGRNNDEIRCSE